MNTSMLFAEPAPAPKEEGPAGGQTCPEDISRNIGNLLKLKNFCFDRVRLKKIKSP